jgi:hypothetical protein
MSKVETTVRKETKKRAAVAPKPAKPRLPRGRGNGDQGGSTAVAAPRVKQAQFQLLGREPRVDLLPTEVHVDRRARALARRAWLGVVVAVAVAALGTGAATVQSLQSSTDLTSAQSEGSSVLQQQLKYSEVRTVQRQTDLIKAAQAVGGSGEIDWGSYLATIASALPANTGISGLTITSIDPVKGFTQSSAPLDKSRIATIQITLSSQTIPSVPDLTDRLSKLKGYADSNITAINSTDSSGGYTSQITLDVDKKALDNKYKYKAGS